MLNTYHDGGLLFFGDVHAAQGDTESTPVTDRIRLDDVNQAFDRMEEARASGA